MPANKGKIELPDDRLVMCYGCDRWLPWSNIARAHKGATLSRISGGGTPMACLCHMCNRVFEKRVYDAGLFPWDADSMFLERAEFWVNGKNDASKRQNPADTDSVISEYGGRLAQEREDAKAYLAAQAAKAKP